MIVQKFRKSLILYSIIGILVSGLIIAIVSIVPLTSKLKEYQEEKLVFAVKTKSLTVNEFLTRAKETASQITSRTRIRDMLEKYNRHEISLKELVSFCGPKLKDALAHSANAIAISRFDRLNNLVIMVNTPIPKEHWFIPPVTANEPVLRGPVLLNNNLVIIVSAPILNRKSERVGTDIVLFNTKGLGEIIRDYEGLGRTGETILGKISSGSIVQFFPSRNTATGNAKESLLSPDNSFISKSIAKACGPNTNPEIITSGSMAAACYPIRQVDWGMIVIMDTDELYAPINRQVYFIAMVIILLLAASLTVMLKLLRPLTNSVIVHTDKLNKDLRDKEIALRRLANAEAVRKINEERMEALLKIYQFKSHSVDEITNFALEEGVRFTGSTVGYLHFFSEDENHIQLYSWSAEALKHCTASKETHYPLDKAGVWAESIRTKKPVIHNDYQNLPDKQGYPEGHFPVKRHMSVPILDDERIIGVVGVGNKEEQYDESDVRQLSLFMNSMWGILKEKKAELEKSFLQSQLQQAQKMEILGRLSGGIAHDFNNLLTAILGYSELTLAKITNEESALKRPLQSIHEAGLKAASLTRQLLAFSRKQVLDTKIVNLSQVINNMSRLIGRIIGDDIQLKIFSQESDGNIMADVGQLEQVLLNLAVNARDAMTDGGTLTISTEPVVLDKQFASRHEVLKPGPYIVLSITDSGIGIPEEVQPRIFEPFFTTKEDGKGTGLGLATTFGIVEQHHGFITVYSEKGKGTTFKIFLPKTGEDIARIKDQAEDRILTGHETILVVDDTPSIRNLVRDTLEPLGYQILEAEDGSNALEICLTADPKIDLLLTDVIMKNMHGPDLVRALLETDMDMKIIFMSGYTDDFIETHSELQGHINFINKPLIPSELTVRLRKVLDDET